MTEVAQRFTTVAGTKDEVSAKLTELWTEGRMIVTSDGTPIFTPPSHVDGGILIFVLIKETEQTP